MITAVQVLGLTTPSSTPGPALPEGSLTEGPGGGMPAEPSSLAGVSAGCDYPFQGSVPLGSAGLTGSRGGEVKAGGGHLLD